MPPFLPTLKLDVTAGRIEGGDREVRRLSGLEGYFADGAAFREAVSADDPVVYTVSSLAPADGDGQLHFGLGTIFPGRIGGEYYMTKGHLHTRREAAELYIGLSGKGLMLLEHEATGSCELLQLESDSLVYVPGHTAHRTINTGDEPLVYLGVYPADAGHDYAFIRDRNFSRVVVAGEHGPEMVDRESFLRSISRAEQHP